MHVGAFLAGPHLCSAPHEQPTAQSLLLMAGLELCLREPECWLGPAYLPACLWAQRRPNPVLGHTGADG